MINKRIDFRDQIARNKIKSYFLMFAVFVVLVALIYVIGYVWGGADVFVILILAIIISLSYTVFSFYNSGKIAVLSVGAKEIKREGNYKQYYDLVEGLTIASGLPMPKLYVMKSNSINAFASGRDPKHSVVCVTEGALEKLDKKELEGVLAHELGHIESYDIRYMTLVAVMVGMISIISEIFLRSLWLRNGNSGGNDNSKTIFILMGVVLAVLAPIVVMLVQLAISRKREFSADANAVRFTRYPPGLIGALKKIKAVNEPEKKVSKAVAPLFFANPFKDAGKTHPSIEKRISLLEKM
jgi:heat shock protein HtpX